MVTGGPMPFYSAYGSELYEFVHEGVPSYWMHPRGIDKNIDSFPTYLLHCIIGHHGLLSLSPIFVLTLVGWRRALRDLFARFRARQPRSATLAGFAPVQLLGALLTAVVLAFYLTRTTNYNYGGVSVALRWMLWLVPFWLLAIPVAFEGWEPGKTARSLIGSALALSVFSAWYPFDGPWKHPWLFGVMERAGWIDYRDPPPQLEHPLSTWINRLPDSADRDPDYWIELTGRETDNRPVAIRIADGGREVVGGTDVRIVEVTETRGGQTSLSRYAVDPLKFAAANRKLSSGHRRCRSAARRCTSGTASWRKSAIIAPPPNISSPPRERTPSAVQAFTTSTTTMQRLTSHATSGSATNPFGVALETQILDDRRQLLTRQR
jgi:hypothetical protein